MPRMVKMAGVLASLALGFVGMPAGAAAQGCVDARLRPDEANAAQVATATLCYVNAERARQGLPALAPQAQLGRAALVHSRDMIAGRFFDHRGSDGSDVMIRVKRTGYFRGAGRFGVGETLAYGTGRLSGARATVQAWMGSPVHRAAMLDGRMREAGIGTAPGCPRNRRGTTYTMVLGYRR